MASLKEVKNRIQSVQSTRKITSAMKLVASSKLHKAQASIESMRPYETLLGKMMTRFIREQQGDIYSPYAEQRTQERVAIVVFSSNSSLCGAFNANIFKEFQYTLDHLREQGTEHIDVIPIGQKVCDKVRKAGFANDGQYNYLLDKPQYKAASEIAATLMEKFCNKTLDRVILIYHHFKNTSSQILQNEDLLPIDLSQTNASDNTSSQNSGSAMALDYIVEPSREEIVEQLIPKVLHLKLYTALLDTIASEHAARVIAMQTATDNADALLDDLTLMYNKTRQSAITNELLDIVGATFQ